MNVDNHLTPAIQMHLASTLLVHISAHAKMDLQGMELIVQVI